MNDENIHIGALLRQFLIYWKIYISIGTVCLIAAICFLMVMPKKYQFTARMQLIRDNQGMMSELKMLKSAGISAMLGGSASGSSVEDEVIVLTSRSNMSKAILETEYQVETREWKGWKNVLLYRNTNPIRFLFPEQFLDTLSRPMKLKLTLSDGAIRSAQIKSDLFETVEVKDQPLPCPLQLPVGTITVMQNADVPVRDDRKLTIRITPLQQTYEDLYDDLYAGAQETVSDIVLLLFEDENKQRGYDVLNTLMAVYNQYSRDVKVKEAVSNARFVKERLDSVTMELAYLEHRIEAYKKQNNIPEPTLYAQVAISGYKELEDRILGTEVRLKMLDYVADYIRNPQNEYASVPAVEGVGEKSIALYNQLVLDRQRLLLSSEKENPALLLAEKQLTEQRKMLSEAIDAVRQSTRASLEEIKKKNRVFSDQLSALPTQEREYIEMKRQQRIKETVYLFLMQKLQEEELVNSPDEQAGRVVDAAYSSAKPVYPKKLVVLAVALTASFILSLIAISLWVFVFRPKE
ncbi:GNVR domain-containing protein [uncultured Bacteroides sp.]|uniref:GumC family protein n=1 Tax=uncultured Bacteroides sp. TaxID=162156 RepID=UPI002612F679|nr:GNVR domain-containing protein [uncultured Bacteroides sp.]